MPSLHDLGEFKASLFKLGKEEESLEEMNLTPDDLPLPLHEPSLAPQPGSDQALTPDQADEDLTELESLPPEASETPSATPDLNFGDLGDLLGGMDNSFLENTPEANAQADLNSAASTGQENIDFGNFIDSIPDDLKPPEDTKAETPAEEQAAPPDGLLDGLADEIEAGRAAPDVPGNGQPEETSAKTDTGDNLDDLDSLDLPDLGEPAADAPAPASDLGLGDLDLPDLGEPAADAPAPASDLDLGDLDLPDLGEPAADAPAPASDLDLGDLDLPDLGEPAADAPAPASDLDLGDLDLPDLGEPAADAPAPASDLDLGDLDLPDLGEPAADAPAPASDLDLGDLDLPDLGEPAADAPAPERGLGNIDPEKLSSFDSDESLDLLQEDPGSPVNEGEQTKEEDNLGDLDFKDTDFPVEESPGQDGGQALDDFDLGDLDDLGSPATPEEPKEEAAEGDELPDDLEELEELPDEGEPLSEVSEPAAPAQDDQVDELGITQAPPDDDSDFDDNEFDLGGESQDFDSSAVLEEISGDSFDNFNLDSNALAGKFDLDDGADVGDISDDYGNLDDFSLSGIDDLFGGKSPDIDASQVSGKAGKAQAQQDEVKEISLSVEELEQLQNTLSSYPLNLRIACEELIAEQAVAPDLMSNLIDLLVKGASAAEAAALAGKILGKTILIPKGFEKQTGEALEAEQLSFGYIFIHNFIPVFRLFLMIALVFISVVYLSWKFIYTPIRAEKIYQLGYERIATGEYARANERFLEAYKIHDKKIWFYKYARAFRDAKQYSLAEEKYQELLYYTAAKNKRHIPEKEAVLEYAQMKTDIGLYESADEILRHNILDYFPMDRDALLALGDNNLAWGEEDPTRLEEARDYYARYMGRYGRTDPLLERMLRYFILTDNLGEVLSMQAYFMNSSNRIISSSTLAELGGYLLDKRFIKVPGVPNEYLDRIGGIREVLLRAIQQDSMLPESYYHLARYYYYFENFLDERLTLDLAVRVFGAAKEEGPKRIRQHILTLSRYGEVLIDNREFTTAENNLVKAVNVYENALSRRLLSSSPEFGKIYADLGDLEYFNKDGNLRSALDYYSLGEQNGWAPAEILYRMGAAHYRLSEWGPAQDRLYSAYRESTPNRRLLYALGNASFMRGNYFAAQGYYGRLLEILESDRDRLSPIMPTDNEKQLDLAERLMVAQNNMGVTLEGLTVRTGDSSYRTRSLGYFVDSERAYDTITRDPVTMLRARPFPNAPTVSPPYLNIQNTLHPIPNYAYQIFLRIDWDMNEPSKWEALVLPEFSLYDGVYTR